MNGSTDSESNTLRVGGSGKKRLKVNRVFEHKNRYLEVKGPENLVEFPIPCSFVGLKDCIQCQLLETLAWFYGVNIVCVFKDSLTSCQCCGT